MELDTIVCGDCLDVMRDMPDGCVDAVITDPPYNVGTEYGANVDDNKSREEFVNWAMGWFRECRRIAKTILITGQPRLPDYALIEPWKWLLVWWKPAAMGRSPVGFCNFEPIAMWGKGGNAGCDVIRAPIVPDKSLNGHPCPKPLGWAEGQIRLLPWAETIFDPFIGSGTTAVAALKLGRHFYGCDINEDYVRLANERIEKTRLEMSQMELSL